MMPGTRLARMASARPERCAEDQPAQDQAGNHQSQADQDVLGNGDLPVGRHQL
jgi:hypothetical protein